ncbi:2-methoxy-6-polyprenyl-1,4-benzoquinol methylase [subsurface metagenome]
MKLSKLERIFVNFTAKWRNIKTTERLFNYIDLDKVEKVLEIGCGIGTLSAYLADKYKWKVTGIDLDPEQIEKTKEYHRESEYLKFIESDAIKLPFENNEFNMVLSFDVLHHIPNRDKALDEINRVLKSDGFHILVDFAFPRLFGKFSISLDDIINQMERNNFKIIYQKKPKVITGWRFSIMFQKSSNDYYK